MIPRWVKEIIRYFIIFLIMAFTYEMSIYAYELEQKGSLTIQFAGIVGLTYGVLTLVLKFVFETKVSDA